MTIFYLICRWMLGLIFFIFGLNGFFYWIKAPPMAPGGEAFIQDLIATGYMLPLWKGTEVVGGFLLLINRYVPLALVLLAPIAINIFLFHFFLDPKNIIIGTVPLLLGFLLAWRYRDSYRSLFRS